MLKVGGGRGGGTACKRICCHSSKSNKMIYTTFDLPEIRGPSDSNRLHYSVPEKGKPSRMTTGACIEI